MIGKFAGIEDILISKTGYTGSGGYEIYIPNKKALKIIDLDILKSFAIDLT